MRTQPYQTILLSLLPFIAIACTTHRAPTKPPATKPAAAVAPQFVPLFTDESALKRDWAVRLWSDVSKPAPEGVTWQLHDGVLNGSEPRGTWLISNAEYADFVLELDFKLGEGGNSGVALRAPDHGDPAFDGIELQMCDERYYTKYNQSYGPASLTGSLYDAIPPQKQVYKPMEWNHYAITCRGPHVLVELNGEVIQVVNLDKETKALSKGEPLRDRPRRGHIGFQELSRGGGHVEIRNARIKVLEGADGK